MTALQIIIAFAPLIEQYGPQVVSLLIGITAAIHESGLPDEVQQNLQHVLGPLTDKVKAAEAVAMIKNHLAAGNTPGGDVLPNHTYSR